MGEFTKGIDDLQFGVARRQHRQRQRYCTSDTGFSVAEKNRSVKTHVYLSTPGPERTVQLSPMYSSGVVFAVSGIKVVYVLHSTKGSTGGLEDNSSNLTGED